MSPDDIERATADIAHLVLGIAASVIAAGMVSNYDSVMIGEANRKIVAREAVALASEIFTQLAAPAAQETPK